MHGTRSPEQASHLVLVSQGQRLGVYPIRRSVWDIHNRAWEITIDADPSLSYDEAKLAMSPRPRKLFDATKQFQVTRRARTLSHEREVD
jgi:hypothetical protein